MSAAEIIVIVLTAVVAAILIVTLVYDREITCLRRENRMLRRLFSEQAKLHQMSFDAYIAMLQKSRRQ